MTTKQLNTSAAAFLTGDALAGSLTDFDVLLGDYAADFDVDAIADEYRAAIDAILPEGVSITGDMVIVDIDAEYDEEEIREAFAEIDLNEIVAKHDRTA